jgi:hypothetical protein
MLRQACLARVRARQMLLRSSRSLSAQAQEVINDYSPYNQDKRDETEIVSYAVSHAPKNVDKSRMRFDSSASRYDMTKPFPGVPTPKPASELPVSDVCTQLARWICDASHTVNTCCDLHAATRNHHFHNGERVARSYTGNIWPVVHVWCPCRCRQVSKSF